MKMKANRILSIIIVAMLCVSIPFASFAHSGRTDGSGGHKDNKNASGLGYYHYHCGGNPPHLHSGGVCPYSKAKPTYVTPPAAKPNTVYNAPTVAKPNYSTAKLDKPTFPVIANGTNLNITTSQYFPIVVNGITYIPLSQDVITALGLTGGWQGSTLGIILNSTVTQPQDVSTSSAESDFYHEHACMTDDNSMYYHRYNCSLYDENSFYIMNIELAESKWYTPCRTCWK